jgi:hypothetical protein
MADASGDLAGRRSELTGRNSRNTTGGAMSKDYQSANDNLNNINISPRK